MRAIVTLILFSSCLTMANAVRTQFFVSALNSELSLRNSTALFFGFESISVGGFIQYESPYSYVKEESFGASVRSGKDIIFEIGAGSYKKKFETATGTGIMGFLSLGKRVASNWVLTGVANYKEISSGDLEKRTVVEIFPTVGFDWDF